MKFTTVKQFRDEATQMLRSKEPILITRRGKIAGFYIPAETQELPFDLRQELQGLLANALRRSLAAQGLTEEDILADFEASRTAGR